MDIFGIGPLEFFFILVIALIVFGPNDLAKAGRSLGRFIRKFILSDEWRAIQQTSREFRNLPNRLMREAQIEDLQNEIRGEIPDIKELKEEIGVQEIQQNLKELEKDVQSWTKPAMEGITSWTTPPKTKSSPAKQSTQPASSPEEPNQEQTEINNP